MRETTVLVAMEPSDRRDRVETRLADRTVDVVTADDGLDAVDRVRRADAVLVGDYPEPVAAAVLDATTPPGVARPNVYLSTTSAVDVVPDERLPADAAVDAVVDAADRAVQRATYARRVTEFSSAAVEAATSDRGSAALAERVTELARDARAVQSNFHASDWVAAFRSVSPSTPRGGERPNSGNRTS